MSHIDVDYKRRRIEDEMPSKSDMLTVIWGLVAFCGAIGLIGMCLYLRAMP